MKKFCPIHSYYYEGNKCPFCEKERIERLAQRFVKTEEKKTVKEESREIEESDLQKLMDKFNNKKK